VKALVIGATGRVGPHAVAALQRAGHTVTALARRLPAKMQAERFVSADLHDSAALKAAARGQDAVFLITPNCEDELALAESAIAALEAVGVGRLAYLGINNVEARQSIPHFACKVAIDHRLTDSNLPSFTLAASYFFQNDAAVLPVIRDAGVYPNPIGEIGISAVDVRDIADALANVLFDDRYLSQTIPVIGQDVLTGPGAAAIWSELLRKPVRYGGDDTAGLADALAQAGATSWLIDDLCQMMRLNQTQGAIGQEWQQQAARHAIGHEPRRYRDFAADLLA
jgi:uncharacterized protein YbjT (DUF2867 family)